MLGKEWLEQTSQVSRGRETKWLREGNEVAKSLYSGDEGKEWAKRLRSSGGDALGLRQRKAFGERKC